MQQCTGLTQAPLFSPLVGDFARGMLVQIPLTAQRPRAPS